MRNGSRSEYYLVEGGLKLTRVRQSEWRRRWGIKGITVFEQTPQADTDDGWSNFGFFPAGTNVAVGDASGTDLDGFTRWDNVTIPAGATVQEAHIEVVETTGTGPFPAETDIFFDAIDDAVAPTDRAEHVALTRTTASVPWDVSLTEDVVTDSPDISAIVQEILDRGGWASGQAMQVLWDGDAAGVLRVSSREDTPARPIVLHVEYSS